MKNETIYIAANKYFFKETLAFGSGVIGTLREQDAVNDSIRRRNAASMNQWFCIEIPGRETFLELSLSAAQQSPAVLGMLCSAEALSMLFYPEKQRLLWQLDTWLRDKSKEVQEAMTAEELEHFYEEKRNLLMELPDAERLIAFVTGKTRNRRVEKSSAFFARFGIHGVFYNDMNGDRVLIFDAKRTITVQEIRREVIPGSRVTT